MVIKLKAISHAVQGGTRAAANINESIVPKRRKQEDDRRQVKNNHGSFRGKLLLLNVLYNPVRLLYEYTPIY